MSELKKPYSISIYEDLFLICGRQYLETLLLEFFLYNGFEKSKAYHVDQICEDIFVDPNAKNAVMRGLQRLVDKKYISKDTTGVTKGHPTKWLLHKANINRDIIAAGFKPR